ncbi:MAG TPA: LuxR C-terminal-related transcriptional regulator [Sphingomicrobium sp.]|nr:LuxR C-terminal-related transcriptional regulator [Sphingomicrobium sp.]
MSLDERVSEVIKAIYRAGQGACDWDAVNQEVLDLVGGSLALTTVVDLAHREYDACRFYGPHDTRFARGVEEYSDGYYLDDPSLAWASANPDARFCDSSRTVPDGEYLDHPYVRWNRARFGSTHWYVGYTPPRDQLSYSFSVHFPAAQGGAKAEALALFRMLFDHLECSISLSRRPFNPNSQRCLALLDSCGAVRELSTAAQELLKRPGALTVRDGRLTTARKPEQCKLDAAIAQVASAVTTGAAPAAVRISHPDGLRPWLVAIRPLLSSFGPFRHVKCELLVEIHENIPRIGSIEVMQSLFGLTGRELQVIRYLADGHSLETLASATGMSLNTGRSHLRAIFLKTGTTRQSELMKLCAGLAKS